MSAKHKSQSSVENKTPKQGFWKGFFTGIASGVAVAIIGGLALSFTTHFIKFWWEIPAPPMVTSSLSPYPYVNSGNTVSIPTTTTVIPTIPYIREVTLKIPNDNPKKCDTVLDFLASDGFDFLPLDTNLPEIFTVEKGYEYTNKMRVYIRDFPPRITYQLKLSVYTLKPDIYGGTEKVICNTIATNY